MLKLKLQYYGHLMGTDDSLKNFLMLGRIEGRRRRGCQRMRWLDSIINAVNMNLVKFWEMVRDREVWLPAAHGVAKRWTRLSDEQQQAFTLLFISFSVFLNFSYFIIYLSVFLLYIFNSLLKTSNTVHPISPEFFEHLYNYYLEFLLDSLLTSHLFFGNLTLFLFLGHLPLSPHYG